MQRSFGRTLAVACVVGLVAFAAQPSAYAQYKVTTLATNQGAHGDPDLINAWGIAHGAPTPFWISDNMTDVSTLYTAAGVKLGLRVEIPRAPGAPAGALHGPSGVVFNGSSDFVVANGATSGPSIFIFTTLDGTVSGWNPAADHTHAIIGWVTQGAVYTGLAV